MKRTTVAKPTTDFASAAMLRVLGQGMRELGLNPEPPIWHLPIWLGR